MTLYWVPWTARRQVEQALLLEPFLIGEVFMVLLWTHSINSTSFLLKGTVSSLTLLAILLFQFHIPLEFRCGDEAETLHFLQCLWRQGDRQPSQHGFLPKKQETWNLGSPEIESTASTSCMAYCDWCWGQIEVKWGDIQDCGQSGPGKRLDFSGEGSPGLACHFLALTFPCPMMVGVSVPYPVVLIAHGPAAYLYTVSLEYCTPYIDSGGIFRSLQ